MQEKERKKPTIFFLKGKNLGLSSQVVIDELFFHVIAHTNRRQQIVHPVPRAAVCSGDVSGSCWLFHCTAAKMAGRL